MRSRSGPPNDFNSFIFLHIPKAAGTTIHHIIAREYPVNALFGTDGGSQVDEFKSLSQQERDKIICLKGHMPFGLHPLMSQPCVYITMLRDPVERIISHYCFVRENSWHYLHKQVVDHNMSLADYASSNISSELPGGQTRLIAGVDTVTAGNITILEQAKKNLRQHFIVAGLVERFDESLLLMKKRLGWKSAYYTRKNVTSRQPSADALSPEVFAIIREKNGLDVELYQFAAGLLDEQIRNEPDFSKKVRRFRLQNSLYGMLHNSYIRSRSKLGAMKQKALSVIEL